MNIAAKCEIFFLVNIPILSIPVWPFPCSRSRSFSSSELAPFLTTGHKFYPLCPHPRFRRPPLHSTGWSVCGHSFSPSQQDSVTTRRAILGYPMSIFNLPLNYAGLLGHQLGPSPSRSPWRGSSLFLGPSQLSIWALFPLRSRGAFRGRQAERDEQH